MLRIDYWEENKKLCRAIPWISIQERLDFRFDGRDPRKADGSEPTSRWVSNFADGRFLALTGEEHASATLYDLKTGQRANKQKQEMILEFLAGNDIEAAHMIIASWYSSIEDEIARFLPGGVRENYDLKLTIEEPFSDDETIKALAAERIVNALVEEQVERIVNAFQHDSEGGLPDSWSLDDFLDREFEESGYIVDRLMKYGSNVNMVAAAKMGKTNLIINLVKSLADGGMFLGSFETQQIKGRICMMDFELDERQAQEWLRRIGIKNLSKVEIYPLRGMPNPFRSVESMRELEEVLRRQEIEFLILDPFSSIFPGDANSNTEVKAFLKELDAFKVRSGVQHLVIAVHAGRNQSQTRGASTLDDHPDALWYLQKNENKRYFKALGRDVEVPEAEITFDPATGEITFHESSKKSDPLRSMMLNILNFVRSNPGCTATELEAGVRGGSTYKSPARKKLMSVGALVEVMGTGGRKSYKVGEIPFDLLAGLQSQP